MFSGGDCRGVFDAIRRVQGRFEVGIGLLCIESISVVAGSQRNLGGRIFTVFPDGLKELLIM